MRTLIVTTTTLFLSACGLGSMPKKMDDTNAGMDDMNGKMDKTNGGLDDMNAKVDKTNGGLAETNGKLNESNAKLDKTNEGLAEMNAKMDKTNAGLDGMAAKLDQTNTGLAGMSGQLDVTNTGLAATNTGLAATNAGVATLNVKMDATNASLLTMLEELKKTNAATTGMSDSMTVTNAAIHNQVLLLATNELTKPENTLVLFPPLAMMPAGKKFAGEARPEEVLELTHTWLVEVDNAKLDPDALRAQGYSDAEIQRMTAQLDHMKSAKFTGLQVISGFLPQPTVEAIAKHVAESGRYRNAGLAVLMLRSVFLQMYMLDGGLLTERLALHGQMIEAVSFVAQLDYLARLPFAAEIMVKTERTGEVRLKSKVLMLRLYEELEKRFDSDLDPMYRAPSTDTAVQRQSEELKMVRTKVQENLQFWKDQP